MSGSPSIAEEERLRRIGAFFCRLAQRLTPEVQFVMEPSVALPPDADPEPRVLTYLRDRREASPAEIRLALGLSRSMIYRSLKRLALEGQVASRGHTKALVYHAVPVDPTLN